MGLNTAIAWTDHTWNPWQGCHKVSPACQNCYMYRDKARYGQDPTTVKRSSNSTFRAPLKWHDPARVFPCSWSDFFIEEADPWREEAWDIIRRLPHLTFQIVTKRTHLIADRLPKDWRKGYPNVWLIATVENQEMFDKRVPELIPIPAVVHGVSIEPMLGPIDASKYLGIVHEDECGVENKDESISRLLNAPYDHLPFHDPWVKGIDWVICGGESGPNARPMHPDWVRFLKDQCQKAHVPFFFKQWGMWAEMNEFGPGMRWTFADGTRMSWVGKERAGRLLDGREWNEFPEVHR